MPTPFSKTDTGEPSKRSRSTGEQVFSLLWGSMVSILGTATTATLVKRASRQAAKQFSELEDLKVERQGLDYRYSLPDSWHDHPSSELPDLRHFIIEQLVPLLQQFTGVIVLQRLDRVPELREWGIMEKRKTA